MAVKLPSGYHIEGGQIVRRWSDKKGEHAEAAAFGTVEVRSVMRYDNKPDELFVVARFSSCDRTRFEDVPVPIKQITGNGKRLLDYVPDWFVLLGTSPTKRLRFLQQTLNLQRLEIKEVTEVQRVGMGYHNSEDGTLFYVLGHQVINQPPDVTIEVTSPFHLRTDQCNANELPGQNIHWALNFCEQGPPQAALFVAALTCYIRPVLEATHNFDRFGVFVVGESGVGKTESAKLICQFFKEEGGATLSSDRPDIFRLMSIYKDLPFLVDDLNSSGISSAMNRKKDRLSEILQQLSGTGVLSIKGEVFDVSHTIPIVTAESLLESPSTINRTLILAFDKSFNTEILTWLQEHQNLYLTFLKDFISWLCSNYTRLIGCVRSWNFPSMNGGKNPSAYVGFHRLMRTFKILKITVELFLLHLREVYAIPQEDEKSWRRLLTEGINQAVLSDTLEYLRKDSKAQERYYVDAVLDIFMYEPNRSKDERLVAKSYKKYVELNKQSDTYGRIQHKVFFESADGDYYCYRGDDLIEYLAAQHDYDYRVSKKGVSKQLAYHGLLQQQAGDLSFPIVEGGKHRFYHLRRNVVEQLLAERQEKNLRLGAEGDGNNDNQSWIIARR